MQRSPVQLLVTVDTEEDNWWPTRVDVSARNVRELPLLDEVLARHGARPTYLVTYRVARDEEAMRTLIDLRDRTGAEIGAHLHPWNTPPQELSVAESVSLAEIPPETQRAMVDSLTMAIEEVTGVRPRSFRAGRWSVPSSLGRALIDEGYVADSSVLPFMHWHDVPGSSSNYRVPSEPYRVGTEGGIMEPDADGTLVEVPATSGFNRTPWRRIGLLDHVLRSPPVRRMHLHGILHRTRLVRRISLTPEQYSARDMLALAEAAVRQRFRVLNLHLHSNSLLPGCNEFIRTSADRKVLLKRLDDFLHGLGQLTEWYASTLTELGAEALDRPLERLVA